MGMALVLSGALASGCSSDPAADAGIPKGPPISTAEHATNVEEWKERRHSALREPDGWLSLAGLMWLDEGESSLGSDPASDFAYTANETPPLVGVFVVNNETVSFEPAPDLGIVTVGNEPVMDPIVMHAPRAGGGENEPFPVLTWRSLSWQIIERDGRLAVRLRDSLSPVLTSFDQVEAFPVDGSWRLDARFEFYDPPKPIKIPSVLGTVDDGESPGAAVFVVDGEIYRLDTWKDSDDPDNFFTAFADATNGDATYGGGRFVWIDAPDENGHTVVDFNKSYNPPCAFTPYSTCPLPPQQNHLPFAIDAGEKTFKSGTDDIGAP